MRGKRSSVGTERLSDAEMFLRSIDARYALVFFTDGCDFESVRRLYSEIDLPDKKFAFSELVVWELESEVELDAVAAKIWRAAGFPPSEQFVDFKPKTKFSPFDRASAVTDLTDSDVEILSRPSKVRKP